jgi:hypothetical protein
MWIVKTSACNSGNPFYASLGKQTATWKTIVWPLPLMVHTPHPATEPYSLTHLPVAFMWVIASTTYFLHLLPPGLPPSEGLRLFFEPNFFTYYTQLSQPQSHSYLLTYEDATDRVFRNIGN